MSTGDLREHAFDGIQEFDNRLPNWWLWTFYSACLFSVGYWIWFHTLGIGELPPEAYMSEQRAAALRIEEDAAKNPVTEESLMKLASEPAVVAAGEAIFKTPSLCAQCHGPDANGMVAGLAGVGPNLTDNRWIHGGSAMEIYRTIQDGWPEKGMAAWKGFGPTFVQRSTAYVLSLRGKNLAGKPPEEGSKEYPPGK
ncbi:MAG: cbb3-type cytochrome c oxidase N-terminal domain-containing protein [Planctomycetota bacterium]